MYFWKIKAYFNDVDICAYEDCKVNFIQKQLQGGFWDKVFNPREQKYRAEEANGKKSQFSHFHKSPEFAAKKTLRNTEFSI